MSSIAKKTFVDVGLKLIVRKIKKGISLITGLWITLTNNEINDIVKVIKSLVNRGILLKGLLETLVFKT